MPTPDETSTTDSGRLPDAPCSAEGIDPYEAFFDWCIANVFRDVAECSVEELDVSRMDAAIAAYGVSPNAEVSHTEGAKKL